ncbi:hypothetical protein A8C32_17695 [Flavivirga aquatica]|uniref:HTH cro/C1-type domain-containing protein n=1 Tax=Flavivirga aquatica TaxID=1849968 RepID=A0A1E5T8D0_9FLAO|nr:helix-turn-helix transcriptional regulator [Flavivirga aquatica]OEK07630.1 hypothetical protein A8C32_17695 [Flavivirga aquatica]
MNGLECKKHRESRGWSQEKLANKAGVSKRTVINWEQSENLSISKVKLLHSIFNNTENLEIESQLVNTAERIENLKSIEDVVDFIIDNEKKLEQIQKYQLWLTTKVQEGVIKILSSDLK